MWCLQARRHGYLRKNSEVSALAAAKGKAPSLAEFAYEEIKKRIRYGLIPPGSQLITQDLADLLGISRTPVVTAVNRLASEGYAVNTPQQGIRVKNFTIKTFRDVFELRHMIEQFAVDGIIKNMLFDKSSVTKLKKVVQGYKTLGPMDYKEAIDIECEFHHTLIGMTNNAEILSAYKRSLCVEAVYYMYMMAGMELTIIVSAYEDHSNIVECMETADSDRLKTVLEKHMQYPVSMLNWLISSGKELIPSNTVIAMQNCVI